MLTVQGMMETIEQVTCRHTHVVLATLLRKQKAILLQGTVPLYKEVKVIAYLSHLFATHIKARFTKIINVYKPHFGLLNEAICLSYAEPGFHQEQKNDPVKRKHPATPVHRTRFILKTSSVCDRSSKFAVSSTFPLFHRALHEI